MPKIIDEDDCPRGLPGWLATFGDLMSLLLTFFVLLLSFSSVNVKEFQHAMGALQGALGVLSGQPQMSLPIRQSLPKSEGNLSQAQVIAKASKELEKAVEEAGLQGNVNLEDSSSGIIIRIADKLFFDVGLADLKLESIPVLKKLGYILKELPNQINVQGHTDNRTINTRKFASNWELSGMRALEVARYLIKNIGISPDQISITGFSEYRPLVPNSSEINMSKNRRVELHILYQNQKDTTPNRIYQKTEDKGLKIKGRNPGEKK